MGGEQSGEVVVKEGEEGPREEKVIRKPVKEEEEDSDAEMFSVMSQVLYTRKR